MYSPNSAYKEGRRIGREHPDIWISNENLRTVVRRELWPRIKLRRTPEQNRRDNLAGWSAMVTVLAILAVAFLATTWFFAEASWMPLFLLEVPRAAVLITATGSGLAAVLLLIAYRMAAQQARARRRRSYNQLLDSAMQGALATLDSRRTRAGREVRPGGAATRPGGYPPPRHLGLTPRGAEELAATWMRRYGAPDAEVTQYRSDGGIDVISSGYIAQVKHQASNTSGAPIRELSGNVRTDGRRGLFFTTGGYTKGAIEEANRSGIALFRMYPEEGKLTGINSIAQALMRNGL